MPSIHLSFKDVAILIATKKCVLLYNMNQDKGEVVDLILQIWIRRKPDTRQVSIQPLETLSQTAGPQPLAQGSGQCFSLEHQNKTLV